MAAYKLLWVDDEIELLKAHILYLEKKGYGVETVTNGYDALDRCAEETFDLILLDENMPGLSGLETLGVERCLAFGATVDNVPILRGHHRHIAQLEHHVQAVERRCGATATAYSYACGGLVLGEVAASIENTLHHRQHTAIRLTVIGRSAYDKGIGSGHFVDDLVARVIVKHTMLAVAAMATSDAAMQRLGAELHQFGLHTMLVQLFRYLAESGEGVAVGSRASVNHQYFHFFAS